MLLVLAAMVVQVTRAFLVRGLEGMVDGFGLSPKLHGQFLGYATSAPELVGTLATASRGLLGAGLWNVAASNIINVVLLATAAAKNGRLGALLQRRFLDELAFSFLAIGVPMALVVRTDWAASPWMAIGLFFFFASYLLMGSGERAADETADSETDTPPPKDQTAGRRGLLLALFGLVGIIILGRFIGDVAEELVVLLGIPQWAVGWCLGVITSLPEMTTFFLTFGDRNLRDGDGDCQRGLDNLAASNMSNIGFVYPLGIFVFLWVGM
jgi:Ca2+/Na+ antiporter